MDWDDIRIFVAAVDAGGFTAAGRRLGQPKSRISRRVARLEAATGTTLLQRSTRRVELTAAGAELYAEAKPLVDELLAVVDSVLGDGSPSGRLVIGIGQALAEMLLLPTLDDFLRRFPGISVQLQTVPDQGSVAVDGADIVVGLMGQPPEAAGCDAIRLFSCERQIVYNARRFGRVRARNAMALLQRLPALAQAQEHSWAIADGERWLEVPLQRRLVVDGLLALRAAACGGLGFAALPGPLCRAQVAAGELAELTLAQPLAPLHGYAIYPRRQRLQAKVRVMLDYLRTITAPWDTGEP